MNSSADGPTLKMGLCYKLLSSSMTNLSQAEVDATLHRARMEELLNSPEFPGLERQLSVNNARFADLPRHQRLLAVYLFHHGGEEVMEHLWTLFYKFRPPTIQRFLSAEYLPDTSQILYPQWRKDLSGLFEAGGRKFEWVLGGCHQEGYLVRMFDGSVKPAESVQVGDQLMGPDSLPRTVWSLARGRSRMLSVETNDGGRFVVNEDHVFPTTKYIERRVKGLRTWKHEPAEVRAADLTLKHNLRTVALEYPESVHQISPYMLGLLIGDGTFQRSCKLYLVDEEVISRVKEETSKAGAFNVLTHRKGCWEVSLSGRNPAGGSGSNGENPFAVGLKELGLWGKNCHNKFLPDQYLRDSRRNRLSLLAGLLDSDGDYRRSDGVFRFTTVNSGLAGQVRELCHSLGFRCNVRFNKPNCTGFANSRGAWSLSICGALSQIPTLSANKRAVDSKKDVSLHAVAMVQELPEDDYYGFNVDGDHLYVGADHYVHHNCIGAGKSTASMLGHGFNLVRVASLLNPHATLGAAGNKNLVLSLFTVTLPKARKALLEPFKYMMLECSKVFEEVDTKEWKAGFPSYSKSEKIPFYDNNSELALPNNISVMLGSQTSHALSFDMFGASLDEAEFRQGGAEGAFEVYSNLKERIRSRFLGSRFTFCTLVSSAKYSTGIIAQYTANLKPDDQYSTYSAYPIWDIKSFSAYKDGHFYVLRGTSNVPSRILESEYEAIESDAYRLPEGCALLKVPSVYRPDFELRIEEAIRNLAGVQTIGADHPFSQVSHIEDPDLCHEHEVKAPLGEGLPLINKLPPEASRAYGTSRRLTRYPDAPRYAHIDLAEVNIGAITISHKELEGGRTVVVEDIGITITSPTRIDVNAVKTLLIDIRNSWGVHFRKITFDQYQSTFARQELEVLKVADEVELLSVDRTIWPISEMARLVGASQYKACPGGLLGRQMLEVTIDDSTSRQKVKRGPSGKDRLDSAIGAAVNAISDIDFPATHEYVRGTPLSRLPVLADKIFRGLEEL
jgi:hypothetical protein